MTFVKIGENLYPATIRGKVSDADWDGRSSKAITLTMDYNTAAMLFVNSLNWSIVDKEETIMDEPVFETDENGETVFDEEGNPVVIEIRQVPTIIESEFDNSEYNIAGDLTDHRDGTITAKMGKLTDLENAYEIMLGGIM